MHQLIRKDIIKLDDGFSYIENILDNTNKALRHAILSLLSVIVSCIKGV